MIKIIRANGIPKIITDAIEHNYKNTTANLFLQTVRPSFLKS